MVKSRSNIKKTSRVKANHAALSAAPATPASSIRSFASSPPSRGNSAISSPQNTVQQNVPSSAEAGGFVPASAIMPSAGNAELPNPSFQGSAANQAKIQEWLAVLSDPKQWFFAPVVGVIYTDLLYADAFGFDISGMGDPPNTANPQGNPSQPNTFNPGAFEKWLESNYPQVWSQYNETLAAIGKGITTEALSAWKTKIAQESATVWKVIGAAIGIGLVTTALSSGTSSAATSSSPAPSAGSIVSTLQSVTGSQPAATAPPAQPSQFSLTSNSSLIIIGIILISLIIFLMAKK